MNDKVKATAPADDDECLHCLYFEVLEKFGNAHFLDKGRPLPTAGVMVEALVALAGDLLSSAPPGVREPAVVGAVSYLVERSKSAVSLGVTAHTGRPTAGKVH